jgi:hypothetical protein
LDTQLQAVEDKTFGMKNKKGAKGQKYVQQLKTSMDAAATKGQYATICNTRRIEIDVALSLHTMLKSVGTVDDFLSYYLW